MAEPLDALGWMAAENVDYVPRPQALARAINTRERLLGRFCPIPDTRWIRTHVAVTARATRFAEIIKQAHAPAAGGLCQTHQRIQFSVQYAFEQIVSLRL